MQSPGERFVLGNDEKESSARHRVESLQEVRKFDRSLENENILKGSKRVNLPFIVRGRLY